MWELVILDDWPHPIPPPRYWHSCCLIGSAQPATVVPISQAMLLSDYAICQASSDELRLIAAQPCAHSFAGFMAIFGGRGLGGAGSDGGMGIRPSAVRMGGCLNDFWLLDLRRLIWTKPLIGGLVPEPRFGATMVSAGAF
jgi:hypothetical protein